MRKVLGVIAGIVAAFVIVICVDFTALSIEPAPAMRPGAEATAAWLAKAPLAALAVIILGMVSWRLGRRLCRAAPLVMAGLGMDRRFGHPRQCPARRLPPAASLVDADRRDRRAVARRLAG
jgi:hypothetical protein